MTARKLSVFALGCHPDDIEFMMAGTLFRLRDLGATIHYMNLANGSCGTQQHSVEQITAMRREEAKNAAALLGASYYPSLVNDLEVFYSDKLVRQVAAILRKAAPDILLLLSPEDYMEDHMNTSRIGVTAAFVRNMPNYATIPAVQHISKEMVIYHALPYGLRDQLGRTVEAELYVDISNVLGQKKEMLSCHKSQKEWLDRSQGLESYINTMVDMSKAMGKMSGIYDCAEGWRRHSHLGYASPVSDPLREMLALK